MSDGRPSRYRTDPSALAVPWFQSPFFEELLPRLALGPEVERRVRQFHSEGYLLLDEPVVDEATLAAAVSELDGFRGGLGPERRLTDAWAASPAVRRVALAPPVLEWLRLLYGREPFPFQTLNFRHGTEQRTHSDAIHFDSVPRGFMAGVWVALEDVHADSGPLHYYPGSHRLPVLDMHDIGAPTGYRHYRRYEEFVGELMASTKLERHDVLLKRGQALIWAANLFHGGSPRRDEARTRLSQVSHYFFEDCLYFAPGSSDPYVGRMGYKVFRDVRTGRRLPSRYRGRRVRQWGPWLRHAAGALATRLGRPTRR